MIPEGCFPVYSQIRSDAYHAGICQIFIYIKSFWQWKFYSASRSHTDHKTILTRFGCWILTVTVSKNTVAYADIFLWNTPLLLQLFSFLGVKNFSCTVNPAESTPRACAAFMRFPITRLPFSTQVPILLSEKTMITVGAP